MPAVLDLDDLAGRDNPADDCMLPVIIRGNQSASAIVQFQCRISECIGNAISRELRTNGTHNHSLFGSSPCNDETANHHVVSRLHQNCECWCWLELKENYYRG